MKKGFTLAEVLITLGIIGIVAALTMPSLVAKYREKQTVTKLKKTYAVLQQAFTLAYNENGPVYTWEGTNGKDVLKKLLPYMKISQNCLDEECPFHEYNYLYLNGSPASTNNPWKSLEGIVLADGEVIRPGSQFSCTQKNQYCTVIQVHTEPHSGSWILGKNWFQFDVYPDKIVPTGSPAVRNLFSTDCLQKTGGSSCTAWVIYNENMDYLRCDDLSWTGKTKCK